ncbi:MAG: aldo/keto reductase [Ruminococcaceae bacterium]|nr:aldo/keto reductase [Oscillospiraceae bacterium]
MRYKHFRNANIDVSAIAVGCWPAGDCGYGKVDDKEVIKGIHAMFDHGVNMIDTAPDYGVGHSEIVVGQALKEVDRSKIILATKCGASALTMKAIRTGRGHCRDGRYENVLYECEQSLRRMGVDYIDIMFVHWPDTDTPFSETMEAMKTLKQQGKIRFVGLSNFDEKQILECEKVVKVDVIQPPYSMAVRSSEHILKWAVPRGVDTCTYGSLGAGILTGAFREAPTFENARDPRNFFYPFFREPSFSKVMKVVEVMDKIAADMGKTTAQVAVNWQTQKPFVSTALTGVRNVAEADELCAAFDWQLTDEQIKVIDDAIDTYLDFDGADRRR